MVMANKERIQKLKKLLLRALLFFFITSVGSVILFRFVPVPVTPLMILRTGEQWMGDRPVRLFKDWTTLESIGTNMPRAVIAAEDQKFEEHFGFDFEAIRKAQRYNERHRGKKMKGASTISQQTAKNVFLWPSRSWVRKGFEVYFTFLLEVFWSKERIMEVYLNVIETGDGIYGAEAAARHYFHKPASRLTREEAALIAAVLPNPIRWNPARPTPYIRKKANRIVVYMRDVEFGEISR